jgi:hypothetical protein
MFTRMPVEYALNDLPDVKSVVPDQESDTATVDGDVDVGNLVVAVDAAGYKATPCLPQRTNTSPTRGSI